MESGTSGSALPQTPSMPPPTPRIWRIGEAEFDEARRELRVRGQLRVVEAKPLALLAELLGRAGQVTTKGELMRAVWPGLTVVEQSLTTAVAKLRQGLGDSDRKIIEAVHGIGYRIGVPADTRPAAEMPRPPFAFQPGMTVPNAIPWVLERPLGRGASPGTWLARHPGSGALRVFGFAVTGQRLEALKHQASLSRILRTALGERDDLVAVADENFEAAPYFVGTSYGGADLRDWARSRGGLREVPVAERIGMVARVARTVAAAHSVGVLHRDLRPEHVLVTEIGDGAAIRLAGFGSRGNVAGAADRDQAAGSAATLLYTAPEVRRGAPPTIGTDLYALGILLYQMVLGDLDRPLTPDWQADVADPLLRQDILETASGDPSRRLASATALADRLEGLDARRAEQARQEREAAEREQLVRAAEADRLQAAAAAQRAAHAVELTRRTRSAASGLLVLLAIAVVLSVLILREREIAKAQRDRAEAVTAAVGNTVASLIDDMVRGLRDRPGLSVQVQGEMLRSAEAILGRMSRFVPGDSRLQRLQAKALDEFANTYWHEDDLPRALAAGQQAALLQQGLLVRDPLDTALGIELARSQRWIGDVKLKQHDFEGALAAYRMDYAVLARFAAAHPQDAELQKQLTSAEEAVGDVQQREGNNPGALATYRHAQRVLARVLAEHPADPTVQLSMSIAEEKIGDALDALGDRQNSLAVYQADLAIRQRLALLDPDNTYVVRCLAVALSDVADEQTELGQPQKALASHLMARAMIARLAALDPGNLEYQRGIADNDNSIGDAQLEVGDADAAVAAYQAGIAIMQSLVRRSADDVGFRQDLVVLRTGLGRALVKRGNLAAAASDAALAEQDAQALAAAHPLDTGLAGNLRDAEALVRQAGNGAR